MPQVQTTDLRARMRNATRVEKRLLECTRLVFRCDDEVVSRKIDDEFNVLRIVSIPKEHRSQVWFFLGGNMAANSCRPPLVVAFLGNCLNLFI